jgi:hypothetical protein
MSRANSERDLITRRSFVLSLCAAVPVFSFDQLITRLPLATQFVNVAREAGLHAKTIFGSERTNKFLLETTGCGCAFIDYDNDGWLDIFLVNGTRFEAKWPPGQAPISRLYKNNRDGTFTDVTAAAGVAHTGWGQGVCAGDYDNDGWDDLYVTYWGDCVLWHNNGNGTFTNVARKTGVTTNPGNGKQRWNTGCAFLDYDKDGQLDLFVANYIDFDPKTAPLPQSGPCLYKGLTVACGPPGLTGGKNILFHNNGDGTFTDVSEKAGILKTPGTYGLGVLVGDFDNDGWPDIYVANDSSSSALYKNNHDGTFTDIALEAGVPLGAGLDLRPVVLLRQVLGQGRIGVFPCPEVVELPFDLLGPASRGVSKQREVRIWLAGRADFDHVATDSRDWCQNWCRYHDSQRSAKINNLLYIKYFEAVEQLTGVTYPSCVHAA